MFTIDNEVEGVDQFDVWYRIHAIDWSRSMESFALSYGENSSVTDASTETERRSSPFLFSSGQRFIEELEMFIPETDRSSRFADRIWRWNHHFSTRNWLKGEHCPATWNDYNWTIEMRR